MRLASTGLLLGVFFLAGARLLAAQPVSDLVAAADGELRTPTPVASDLATAVHLDFRALAWPAGSPPSEGLSKLILYDGVTQQWQAIHVGERRPTVPDRRPTAEGWVARNPFGPTSPGIALLRTANPPRGTKRLNRTLLPIPLIRWQRSGALITDRGSIDISPALVVGRRLSFLPDLFPGGRTFGIAVQMKIRLDQPGTRPPAAALPGPAILSKVRALVNR